MDVLQACKNYQLIAEGDQDVSLYFVVMGCLKVSQSLPQLGHESAREVMNWLCALPTFFDIEKGWDWECSNLCR